MPDSHPENEPLRSGAQCVYIRCMEPSMNTPGAQRRIDDFIEPLLQRSGVKIDDGKKGRPRWLKDRLQMPGIIRRYDVNHLGVYRQVVEEALDLAINVHGPEMIILIEHTNCGERFVHYQKEHGVDPPPAVETRLIRDSLNRAAEFMKAWYDSRGGDGDLTIIRAVGVVNGSYLACERRFEGVMLLDEFLELQATPLEDSDSQSPATAWR